MNLFIKITKRDSSTRANESGRIKRRFGSNIGKKDWKIMVDSYVFSNAIRLIIYLITGKWLNFYFNAFFSFRIWFWKGQHNPFHTKIDKFSFFLKKESCKSLRNIHLITYWLIIWLKLACNLHHIHTSSQQLYKFKKI